jgi:hypothetical protein
MNKIKLYINKKELIDNWKHQSKATEQKPVDISYFYGDYWLDLEEAKRVYGKNSKFIEIVVENSL